MLFSDYFNVDKKTLKNYGAVDISLLSDSPLFIDPILIYGNDNTEIKNQYPRITRYLLFLAEKATNHLSEKEKAYYFKFKEVKENWLGLCKKGNTGLALGDLFADELSKRIGFVCQTNGVSDEIHVEKMYLIDRGVGKDKISDWTANILLDFFVRYTEKFAKKYINPSFCKVFEVRKCVFNYKTELFEARDAYLPYLINKKGKPEYVLLTPESILRVEEQDISYSNFEIQFDVIRKTIPNDELRFQIDKIYSNNLKRLYDERRNAEKSVLNTEIYECKMRSIEEIIKNYPIIYDYFIAHEENDLDLIKKKANAELINFLLTIIENETLNLDVFGFGDSQLEFSNSFDESLYRINYLKRQIETNGVYKCLYVDGQPIKKEENLQSLFKLVWCRSRFMFSPESNSGAGPSDFLVSLGRDNSTIIEYKLASNPKINNVFSQVKKYRDSHDTSSKSIIVIFCFNANEIEKGCKIKNKADHELYEVVLIDCDSKTKKSASNEVEL